MHDVFISVLSAAPGSSVEPGFGSMLSLAGFVPAESCTELRAFCWEIRRAKSSSACKAVELNSLPGGIVSENKKNSLRPTCTGRNGRVTQSPGLGNFRNPARLAGPRSGVYGRRPMFAHSTRQPRCFSAAEPAFDLLRHQVNGSHGFVGAVFGEQVVAGNLIMNSRAELTR